MQGLAPGPRGPGLPLPEKDYFEKSVIFYLIAPDINHSRMAKGGEMMREMKNFSERIRERLRQGQEEREKRKAQLNIEMKGLLDKQKRFYGLARDILVSAIYPRLEELARQFDNSSLGDIKQADELRCTCKFAHSKRFPATASIEFVISPDEGYDSMEVEYRQAIFPMLMDYAPNGKKSFPLETPSWDELKGWVETKILDFVDIYLKLEIHPFYQKENMVLDPVCGMMISITEAAGQVESEGRIVYFCSDVCRANYLMKKKAS